MTALLNQPLTIQKVGSTTTDEFGDEVTTPIGSPVAALGYLELSQSTEFNADRTTVVTKWKAFLPTATDIGRLDYINFDAQKFQVDGEPWRVYNPRTRVVHHIECNLIVVAG